MANDINDILGINLPPEQPQTKRKIIEDLLTNLVFSIGQGYSAQAGQRGPAARSAGIGAALQGPMVLQQIRQKQAEDAQDRQINMAKARELFRQGRNSEALELLKVRTQLPEETPASVVGQAPMMRSQVTANVSGTPETGLNVGDAAGLEGGTQGVEYGQTRPEFFTLPSGQQVPLYPPSAGQNRQAQGAADARTLALEEAKKRIEAQYRAPQNIDPNSTLAHDRDLAYQRALSQIPNRPTVSAPTPALSPERLRQEKELRTVTQGEAMTLTPAGLDAAATAFAKTGLLPPMGMGKQATSVREKIINRAAEMVPNLDIAGNKADFAANQQSLTALTKNRDAVVAFENTASKNLDVFLKTAEKVADSGSPWVNQPLRAVNQRGLGDAGLAAFNAARQTAINEIAKVISNPNLTGQLSDSARKEVEAFIPSDATLKQVVAVAKILKQDMQNRHDSLNEQIGAIQGRIKGGTPPGQPPAAAEPDFIRDPQSGKIIPNPKKKGG